MTTPIFGKPRICDGIRPISGPVTAFSDAKTALEAVDLDAIAKWGGAT